MSKAGRINDISHSEHDAHGCPSCPHGTEGTALTGSSDVLINGRRALRVGDIGKNPSCCGSQTWRASSGWSSVLVNGAPIHTAGDETEHCGGLGILSSGSGDVLVGGSSSIQHDRVSLLSVSAPLFRAIRLGVDGRDLVQMIEAIQHGLEAGLQEAISISIERLIARPFRLLDKVARPLGTILEDIVLLRGAGIPFLSEVLPWIRIGAKSITNVLLDWNDAKEQEGQCPVPAGAPLPLGATEASLTFKADLVAQKVWDAIPANVIDISRLVGELLYAFRPVFVVHKKDYRATSFEKLLKNGKLTPLPEAWTGTQPTTLFDYNRCLDLYPAMTEGEGRDSRRRRDVKKPPCSDQRRGSPLRPYLDIDNEFAVEPESGIQQVYYGRATKVDANTIDMMYMGIRTISLSPDRRIDISMLEHEGDSEKVHVRIVRQPGSRWRLAGVNFNGLHYKGKCYVESVNEEHGIPVYTYNDTGRPMVFVAIGSHAFGPDPGKRKFKAGGVFPTIDYYPSAEEEPNIVANYALKTSADHDVRCAVFTSQVIWGGYWIKFAKEATGPGFLPDVWPERNDGGTPRSSTGIEMAQVFSDAGIKEDDLPTLLL